MKTVLYTAKEGEKLSQIAARFHTAEAAIRAKNGLKGEPFEGMKLLIEEQEAFGYTVRPFDTVGVIAGKFNTTSERIRELNGIDEVFVGQRILVPSESE